MVKFLCLRGAIDEVQQKLNEWSDENPTIPLELIDFTVCFNDDGTIDGILAYEDFE